MPGHGSERAQAAEIVDHVPDLSIRNASIEPRHHTWRKPALDDAKDVGVRRAVVPLIVREIRRLLASLLVDDGDLDAGFDRALRTAAVTARAVDVVDSLPHRRGHAIVRSDGGWRRVSDADDLSDHPIALRQDIQLSLAVLGEP